LTDAGGLVDADDLFFVTIAALLSADETTQPCGSLLLVADFGSDDSTETSRIFSRRRVGAGIEAGLLAIGSTP
jgi:hypothetical protein